MEAGESQLLEYTGHTVNRLAGRQRSRTIAGCTALGHELLGLSLTRGQRNEGSSRNVMLLHVRRMIVANTRWRTD